MPASNTHYRISAPSHHWLANFILLSWLHVLWLSAGINGVGEFSSAVGVTLVFRLASWLCYGFLYLVPVLFLTKTVLWLLPDWQKSAQAIALLGSTLVLVLLKTDLLIYGLYHFHFNSFILNLVLTPGGISSLGSSTTSYYSATLLVLGIIGIQFLFMLGCRNIHTHASLVARQSMSWAAMLVLFLVQGTVYGISDLQRFGPVLESSQDFPFYQRIRFRSLARHLGYDRDEQTSYSVAANDSGVVYPLDKVAFTSTPTPPNIILLVAESLRWDQLSPEIMPNTWAFSNRYTRFANHYSAGNGTREGLFGMFYGLYGAYWTSFMHAGQEPLLMQELRSLGYDFDIRTSATFTYPEFNKTLFVGLPDEQLVEADAALEPWQRDQANTDALISFLQNRASDSPFMGFFFFESTHAAYSFPPDTGPYSEYAEDPDYTALNPETLARDRDLLFNRYRNAANWIDQQLGRIYTALDQEGLLDNTIVVVTGDHGEEFMEKGAWGHNSNFTEEQTHVPLAMHFPDNEKVHGHEHEIVDRITSHLDIATTLLQALGAPEDTAGWSLGSNLHASDEHEFIVLSDWHSISVQTDELKYRIPYLNTGIDNWQPTDANDAIFAGEESPLAVENGNDAILQAIANTTLFRKNR